MPERGRKILPADRYRHDHVGGVSLHPRSVPSRYVTELRSLTPRQLAAKYASLTRSRALDDPEVVAVRSRLAAIRLGNAISAELPLLVPADRVEVAQALLGGAA